jgi:tRNA pseudouridine38-40 synthase
MSLVHPPVNGRLSPHPAPHLNARVRKLKLVIAFDGTGFHGWQSQPSGRGVQDAIEQALAALFPSQPRLTASSRTDAGVHALGMVVHFELPAAELRMTLRHLPLAINALLPREVRVSHAAQVPPDFHARFGATGKQYRYQVWNHPAMNPLLENRAWHVPRPLDLDAMRRAAATFHGTHDFRAFTSNRGTLLEDPVRTLRRCEIRRSGPQLTFVLEGSGFLYKMCRAIVGTLVQIGEGRFPPDTVARMLDSGDRQTAGMNAPAHGLTLWRVSYGRP